MKRFFAIILAVVILLSFAACNDRKETAGQDESITQAPTEVPTAKPTLRPTEVPTEKPTDVPTNRFVNAKDIDLKDLYIGNRYVYYKESTDEYLVFFGFNMKDDPNNYLGIDGTAHIKIKDKSDYVLYEQAIDFGEADFTTWTNQFWDGSRYLCGLYIPRSELDGSASSSGVLSLYVKLKNVEWYYDWDDLNITNLPDLKVNIALPELPAKVRDISFFGSGQVYEVESVSYETNVHYDGKATVTLSLLVSVASKTKNIDKSEYVKIGYKLYDQDGVIIASGTGYFNEAAVGEKVKDTIMIMNLDPRIDYTLVFTDIEL